MINSDPNIDQLSPLTPEQHLKRAATFMAMHGINAVLVDGTLGDGRSYEGLSFMGDRNEIGELRFADGEPLPIGTDELSSRLKVQGFISEVIEPTLCAASAVYQGGSDLLDGRFNVLPGFTS